MQKNSQPIKHVSYLDRITFDKKLFDSPIAKYIVNIRIVILFIISILAIGIFSFLQLPKRLNPEIKIPIISVVTILPGASPEDIESLITIPIENKLRSIKGVDQLSSSSRENISIVSLQFFSSVLPEKAKSDVQSQIDSFSDLPKDAKTPQVSALDFEDQPVWTFSVSTEKDVRSLMTFAEVLKEKLGDLPKVDRVVVSGFEEQEISVHIQMERLKELEINPLTLSQILKTQLVSYPAGNVNTSKNTYALTLDPQISNIDEIRKIRLKLDSKIVLLEDIAQIQQRSKKNQKASYLATKDKKAMRDVIFYVYKTTGTNIDEAERVVSETVLKANREYDNRFEITSISNTAKEIEDQFSDLLEEFRTTILLIVGCLFLFLGLRQAIIASFTVPLTFLSGFFLMQQFGQSINFLTLFAILLALGLLIDDTIVVVQAMTTYYKTGKFSPAETGLLVWRDTIIPIWSTTITTIWSFVPLLITSGIIGEFIKPIPVVVSVVMVSSTAIAVLITLPLMIVLLKPKMANRVIVMIRFFVYVCTLIGLLVLIQGNVFLPVIVLLYTGLYILFFYIQKQLKSSFSKKIVSFSFFTKLGSLLQKYSNHGVISIEPLAQAYYKLILRILNSRSSINKTIIAIVIYSIFSFSLLPLGFVKNEFFPKTDNDLFYVGLSFPAGTNLTYTHKETLLLLEKLRHIPYSMFVSAEVGQEMGGNFSGSRMDSTSGSLFTIHLQPEAKRPMKSMEIAQQVRELLSDYRKGKISVVEVSGGPPAGADVQVKLVGNDLNQLNKYADKTIQFLQKTPGLANIDKTIKTGTSKLVFIPDKNLLAQQGVSVDSIGLWMRLFASGFPLESVNFDKTKTEKQDVTFYLSFQDQTPEQVTTLSIPNMVGDFVTLSSLGKFEAKSSPSLITRENGKRTVSVSASVLSGYSIPAMNSELIRYVDTKLQMKDGYEWKTGGANEENQKSIQSILQAMVISALLILVTMVIQFQSYRQAVIVLIVIPLAVSSVFVAFSLFGIPISFPAMIGILSLFGIVVTNSMFIVDKININLKEGMAFKEAIADAGASRLEPIILTKLNTILGLLPITFANPLWRGLGGAIISGLLIASTIMLLFIPALYFLWFEGDQKKN